MKKLRKRDYVALAIMMAATIGSFCLWAGASGKEEQVRVVVTSDGKEILNVPLSVNQAYEFHEGGGRNRIIIKNQEVWMEEADCPGKDCILQGKITKNGQSIVCLPHKLVISIKATDSTESPKIDDAV